jgi:hypothetical protein
MIDNYSHGGKKPRDVDTLQKYAFSFKEGSTRRKVYDRMMREAMRMKRAPDDAAAVLAEIRVELRTYIWETEIQKMTRLDTEFNRLQQGGMKHADFRALWLDKLEDIAECTEMDKKTPQQLYIAYLNKITPTLRAAVLSKEWRIDGNNAPPRNPKTHQDIAKACGLVLEERADISCTGDSRQDNIMIVEQPPAGKPYHHQLGGNRTNAVQCSYCKSVGNHHTVICPQKAADTRNHAAICRTNAETTGARCTFVGCNSTGHEAKHHLMAITDYNGNTSPGKGKGKGQYENQNWDNHDKNTPYAP